MTGTGPVCPAFAMRRVFASTLIACCLWLLVGQAAAAPNLSPADRALVDRLVAAPTAAARRPLLAAARPRITGTLIDRVLADANRQRAHQSRALRLVAVALEMAELIHDASLAASCYFQRGALQSEGGDRTSATTSFQRALAMYARQGDRSGMANCHRGLADLAAQGGAGSRAMDEYDHAARLFLAAREKGGAAECRVAQGQLAVKGGDRARARSCFAMALQLYRSMGSHTGEAECGKFEGDALVATGDYEGAMAAYARATRLYRAAGSREGEGNCLMGIADIAVRKGNFADARTLFSKARALYHACKQILAEANCFQCEADMSVHLEDFDQARLLFGKGIPLYRAGGDAGGEANCHKGLGEVAYFTAHDADAQEHYSRAIVLDHARGDRAGEAASWQSKGDVALHQKLADHAARFYSQGAVLYHEVGNRGGEADCIKGLGDVALFLGQLDRALVKYGDAIPLYQAVDHRLGEAWAFHGRSLCLEQKHRKDDAMQALEAARAAAECLAEWGGTPGARSAVMAQFVVLYHDSVRVALSLGQQEQAFAMAEAAHARKLFEVMQNGGLFLASHLTADERREANTLELRLSRANTQWTAAVSRTPNDSGKLRPLDEARTRAHGDIEEYEKLLFGRHPRLAAMKGPRSFGASDAAALLPPDTLLVEYVVNDSETVVFVLSSRGLIHVYRNPVSASLLTEEVHRLRDACARRGGTGQPPPCTEAERNRLLAKMYDQLVRPALVAAPNPPRHLIVVPDGPLFELPFHALTPAPGHYLVEDLLVTSAPSASLLGAALQNPVRGGRPRPTVPVVVFAAPDFGQRAWISSSHQERSLAPMPAAVGEAAALQGVFGDAQVFRDTQAQESRARERVPHARYVHFATHAMLDDAVPLYGALALARPAGTGEDGFLEARELAAMTLAADLVMLSSCVPGQGTVRIGDGVLGFVWGATVAGAPSVVTTLWEGGARDPAMATLARQFYARLKDGTPRGQALREAQLSVLRQAGTADPYYWAAPMLSGDWR